MQLVWAYQPQKQHGAVPSWRLVHHYSTCKTRYNISKAHMHTNQYQLKTCQNLAPILTILEQAIWAQQQLYAWTVASNGNAPCTNMLCTCSQRMLQDALLLLPRFCAPNPHPWLLGLGSFSVGREDYWPVEHPNARENLLATLSRPVQKASEDERLYMRIQDIKTLNSNAKECAPQWAYYVICTRG